MGSDRARVSYDPSRKWRGLVAQQGRVTVEADWNEAASIDAERDRAATLDIVGPVGTPAGPPSGYTVTAVAAAGSPATPGDLTVGPGTLYLGGERLDLDAAVDLADQPDWLNQAADTLWMAPAPASPPVPVTSELVYLLAIEQEVSAVEDPALSDVALGGPDTMQRLRILQHFVRWPTQAADCAAAWAEVEAAWATIGLTPNTTSMRLDSTAALQAGFVTDPAPAGPCEPVATGGYLGAENQLIRVQISSVNPAGEPTIVWGYDDATFLYQVTPAPAPDGSGNLALTLAEPPVDSFHYPLNGQAVELLSDAAILTPVPAGGAAAAGYIVAAAGAVTTLTQGYDPVTRTVAIAGPLPPELSGAGQLYLRVWQAAVPAPAGTAVELTALGAATGVTVTLTPAGGPFHPGDFWRFALRPSVPNLIYPARIGTSAQPPDGPRVWACPVAFVSWDTPPVVSSCLPPFESLTKLTGLHGGCCTLNISPADIAGGTSLQALLASHLTEGPITACLAPGTYALTEPLVFGPGFNDLTLQACGPGVFLQAPSRPGPEFVLGLIVVEGATAVTIRGLTLAMPPVTFPVPAGSFSALSDANQTLLAEYTKGLQVLIGISVSGSTTGLTVEDCIFELPDPSGASSFSAGIFATSAMSGLTIRGCGFESATAPVSVPFHDLAAGIQSAPPNQLAFGYLQVPGITAVAADAAGADAAPPSLHDAVIEQNRFEGVTVPALIMAQIGTLRADRNTVRNCYAGLWLVSIANPAQVLPFFDPIAIGNAALFEFAAILGISALLDRILVIAAAVGQVLPATPPAGGRLIAIKIVTPTAAQLTLAHQTVRAIFTHAAASGSGPVAAPASGQQAAGTPGEQVTEEAAPGQLPPAIDAFLSGLGTPADAGIPVADTGTSDLAVRLDLCDCQVDAVIADSYSGAGLLVLDLTAGTGSALLHDNRIRSRFPFGAAVLVIGITPQGMVGFGEACVTGNIVANEVVPEVVDEFFEGPVNHSMVLSAALTPLRVPVVAITGNVFIDPTLFPQRQLNIPSAQALQQALGAAFAGLEDWDLLNTVVDYVGPPVVASLDPARGPFKGQTRVAVAGAGFTGVTQVNFGPHAGTIVSGGASDTSLTVTSPTVTPTGGFEQVVDVTVVTPAGTSAIVPADQFTYIDLQLQAAAAEPAAAPQPEPAAAPQAEPAAAPQPEPAAETATESAASTAATQIIPPAPGRPPLRVRVTNSADVGQAFDLHSGELTIGREEGSEIQLQDTSVSHNHALLRVHGEDATIDDLRSTNGTKVNGVAIGQQTPLAPGDQIEVGLVRLLVEQNQAASPGEP